MIGISINWAYASHLLPVLWPQCTSTPFQLPYIQIYEYLKISIPDIPSDTPHTNTPSRSLISRISSESLILPRNSLRPIKPSHGQIHQPHMAQHSNKPIAGWVIHPLLVWLFPCSWRDQPEPDLEKDPRSWRNFPSSYPRLSTKTPYFCNAPCMLPSRHLCRIVRPVYMAGVSRQNSPEKTRWDKNSQHEIHEHGSRVFFFSLYCCLYLASRFDFRVAFRCSNNGLFTG